MNEKEIKALIDDFKNSLKQIPINITDKDAKAKVTKQVEETLKLIDEALDEKGINQIIGMSEANIKADIFQPLTNNKIWKSIHKGINEETTSNISSSFLDNTFMTDKNYPEGVPSIEMEYGDADYQKEIADSWEEDPDNPPSEHFN